jgi:hypothetical protein
MDGPMGHSFEFKSESTSSDKLDGFYGGCKIFPWDMSIILPDGRLASVSQTHIAVWRG